MKLVTQATPFAQAPISGDNETRHAGNVGNQFAGGPLQTDDSRPRKKQRLTGTEMNDNRTWSPSSSPSPIIKIEDKISLPLSTLPVPGSSSKSQITPKVQQPKKTRPNQRTNDRAQLLWSDEETADLIKGVNLVGYGRWRLVLDHPDLKFLQERTSVDLKDRTCLNNGWATNTTKKPKPPRVKRKKSDSGSSLLPPHPSNAPFKTETPDDATGLSGIAQHCKTNDLPCSHSPGMHSLSHLASENESKSSIRLPRRKQKQPWTQEEDSLLWAGYKKHGFKWRAIAKDDSLGLSHRRCTAIRDRFRLRLPSLYMDNVKIENGAEEGGKRKMHWSLRKLVGRDLGGPDPVLLALSDEGPGDEEGEATFTDQEDEDGDNDDGDEENEENEGNEEDVDEGRVNEIRLKTNELTNSTKTALDSEDMQQFEGFDYGLDALEFDFSASEPLIQRFFNDEDFDLGYDEDADEDYFDDGILENEGFPTFAPQSGFAEDPPDFSELWNDNDEEGRDEDSNMGSEDEDEQGETDGFEEYLEDEHRYGGDGRDDKHSDHQVQNAGTNLSIAAAPPLLWEEMATQPIFDLEDEE